jgi:Fe2+ transport system protein FeoA
MDPTTETETDDPKPAKWCWFARWIGVKRTPEPAAGFSVAAQTALDAAGPEAAPVVGHGSLYRAGLTLAELKPGECGTVRRLFGPAQGRLRLLELGLTTGVHIAMVRAAAFGGPLDIVVRGYQLSLRREEAAGVWLDDPDDEAAESTPLAAVERDDGPSPEDSRE